MVFENGAWVPDAATVARANVTALMRDGGFADYPALFRWSADDRIAFWGGMLDRLGIVFEREPEAVLTDTDSEVADWLPGARMNIAESCFTADPDEVAVVHSRAGHLHRVGYGELRVAVDRFACGFASAGYGPSDRVAIAMPMTIEAVIAYLGVVLAGGVVVSIADSFAPHEIATRLRLTEPVVTVTQDRLIRAGRELPMYEKVAEAGAARCIVVETGGSVPLREVDQTWNHFLGAEAPFAAATRTPGDHINVLFSSGTTGTPKVIPWTHTTAIKAATDGFLHQDIHRGDVVAWPTNLGWMMGPWLIFASFVNGATMALYDDAPGGRGFLEFVRDAEVTVLGMVPSLVAAWRAGGHLSGIDMSRVRVLSSTGEASSPDDYRWLMETVEAPMIEYIGGTEIGGGYMAGTVVEPAIPSTFTTPTLGLDVRILDDEGNDAPSGELFVVPPAVGLSNELIGRDHHEVYFAGVPDVGVPLRRHGDHIERLPNGYYRALGRVDDAMNLGGIKVSSAELERTVGTVSGVREVAAVAVPPEGGGPGRLVVFVVPEAGADLDAEAVRAQMQGEIAGELNPLFKIHDVVVIPALPRTASAKVMRRELRDGYPVSEPQ
jgi:acetyl-CoA synthetase